MFELTTLFSIVLAALALECIVLSAIGRLSVMRANLGAAAALGLAVLFPQLAPGLLAAALVFHLIDLRARLQD